MTDTLRTFLVIVRDRDMCGVAPVPTPEMQAAFAEAVDRGLVQLVDTEEEVLITADGELALKLDAAARGLG